MQWRTLTRINENDDERPYGIEDHHQQEGPLLDTIFIDLEKRRTYWLKRDALAEIEVISNSKPSVYSFWQ